MLISNTELSAASGALAGAGAASVYFGLRARQVAGEFTKKLLNAETERRVVTDYIEAWVAAVSEGCSRTDLYEMLMKSIERATGASLSAIFERQEDDTLLTVSCSGLFPPLRAVRNFSTRAELIDHLLKRESYKTGDGIIGAVAREREGVFIERPGSDARVYRHDDEALELRSLIVVPIAFQKTLFGVLAIANPRGKKRFGRHDLHLTQALAEQAALALYNSDLMGLRMKQNRFDFDLSVASSIQTMLLPSSFPKNSQLDINPFYLPAQKVGGDLYDVFELPEGEIGVVIADVSGKGIPASLLMAITQSHMRHLARIHNSPAKVLCEMNRILQPEIRQEMFVTLTYAVIDPDGGQMVWARAGHELPLIVGPSRVEFLASEGIAIGMAAQHIFENSLEEKRMRFNKGETLLLYTDGLTEAINSIGEEFGARRVAQLAQQSVDSSSEAVNTRIVKALENFTGKRQQADDVTLLTIRHL